MFSTPQPRRAHGIARSRVGLAALAAAAGISLLGAPQSSAAPAPVATPAEETITAPAAPPARGTHEWAATVLGHGVVSDPRFQSHDRFLNHNGIYGEHSPETVAPFAISPHDVREALSMMASDWSILGDALRVADTSFHRRADQNPTSVLGDALATSLSSSLSS